MYGYGWQKGHEKFLWEFYIYSYQGHLYEILKDYINLLTHIVENNNAEKIGF